MDLYSSMDRLETKPKTPYYYFPLTFIFQYGQIRNWALSDDAKSQFEDLYSSMDRLETLQKY